MPLSAGFARFIGINYSGAETCDSYLPRIRVYVADANSDPVEVPPPDAKQNWNRRTVAEWLVQALAGGAPTLVGINHAFSVCEENRPLSFVKIFVGRT